MLQPLVQYICDSCGQTIEKPEDGWVEWLSQPQPKETLEYLGFRIAHHNGKCERYLNHLHTNDWHLDQFINERYKLPFLYGFLDKGPILNPNFLGPDVVDIREFMEFLRRMMLPYYEEARQYFNEAESDGFFQEENDLTMYTPETLIRLIRQYSQ